MRDDMTFQAFHSMISDEGIKHIDLKIAQMLLKGLNVDEDVVAFIVKLSLCTRLGHVCLRLDGDHFIPKASYWIGDAPSAALLDQMADRGYHKLPKDILSKEDSSAPIVEENGCVYFQKSYFFERRFFSDLTRITSFPLCGDLLLQQIDTSLNDKQQQALKGVFQNNLSLITGGPGTGKTYTAAHIVRSFHKTFKEKKGIPPSIILAAPTGKAAAHLEKSVRRHIPEDVDVRSGTLHLILSIKSAEDMMEEPLPLFAELIIVDEASMIDTRLFSYLLRSIQQGTRVVLMGDKNQLPPVDSGSFFSDLIDMSKSIQHLACTELIDCLRSDKKEILAFADAVNRSDKERALEMLSKPSSFLVRKKIISKKSNSSLERLWQSFQHNFPSFDIDHNDLDSLIGRFDGFRILSCLRKGPLGVDGINRYFFSKFFEQAKEDEWFISPIMITKNDYTQELFNGDTGVLIQQKKRNKSQLLLNDVALFLDKKGCICKIPALTLPSFEYAYALSVHKSQGSEYDHIFVLAQEGAEAFGKEVLYTAVTRARQSVSLDIDEGILEKILIRSSKKISGLSKRK